MKNSLDLLILKLRKCNLEFIDNLFLDLFRFRKLKHLDLSFNKLYLSYFNIIPFYSLRKLYLNNIKKDSITEIPSKLNLNKLIELDLCGNKIDFFSFRYLSQAAYLESLNLANTNISNFIFENHLKLSMFVYLKNLNLSNNFLKIFCEKYLQKNFNLVILDLSHNNINFIEDRSFKKLIKLEILDLSFNRLEYLKRDIYDTNSMLFNLSIINLKNNNIVFYDIGYYIYNSIDISFNNLNEMPIVLKENSIVALDLNLNSNKINQIQSDYFLNLRFIFKLSINENQLSFINETSFKSLTSLKHLDLSINNLTFLQEKIFNGLYNLEYLNLSFNKLRLIQKNTFIDLINLNNLDLSNNLISSIEENSFLSLNSLNILYLNSNSINNLIMNRNSINGLNDLKFFYIPKDTIFNFEIMRILSNYSSLIQVKQVLHMRFYESKSIINLPIKNEAYNRYDCFYINYLLRKNIQLNLDSENNVAKY